MAEKKAQRDDDEESGSIAAGTTDYEAKLVRKLDMHIVPIVMLLYLFSFLDRVNIGSARLYGMEEDLGLKGNQYQLVCCSPPPPGRPPPRQIADS
jgi:hypothetical protein